MPKLKCWEQIKGGLPGISGVNGNYVWQNKTDTSQVIEIQQLQGGRGSITVFHNMNKSGWGHIHRQDAINEVKKYLKEHDRC